MGRNSSINKIRFYNTLQLEGLVDRAFPLLGLVPSVITENVANMEAVVEQYDEYLPLPELIEEELFRWKGRSAIILIAFLLPLIHFRTLLLRWILYVSHDLLLFVPLSRHLSPPSPPHPSHKISSNGPPLTRVVTIRYPHDTIRIAILGENRKMNQLITIGSLYCILCSFDLSRQHLAFALLLFNSMNTLYIIVWNKLLLLLLNVVHATGFFTLIFHIICCWDYIGPCIAIHVVTYMIMHRLWYRDTYPVFCPGFQKDRVLSEKGTLARWTEEKGHD